MMNINAIPMVAGKLGAPEIILIVVVLLLLFGPKYLPKLGQSVGNTIRGFKEGLTGDDEKKAAESDNNGKTEA